MKMHYATTLVRRARSKACRDLLRLRGRCINGSLTGEPSKRTGRVHGVVIHGGRCAVCLAAKS